jgi:hypothetical protein
MSPLVLAEAPQGIRPDDWDFPLFLHVLGSMVMVGALVTAAYFLFAARRDGSLESLRAGYRTLLLGAIPAYIAMRVGAEWISDKEGWNDVDPTPDFIDIGYMTSDPGALLIIISTVLAGLAVRRAGQTDARAEGGGAATAGTGVAIAGWLTSFMVLAFLVAVWAMTTKAGV